MPDETAGLPADTTTWRLALAAGLWTCAWCAAQLTNEVIAHKPGCRWVDEIAAEAARQERQRIIELATRVHARYVIHEMPDYTGGPVPKLHAFADLLEGDAQ